MSFFERHSPKPPRTAAPPPRGTVRLREPSTPTPAPTGATGHSLVHDTPTNDRDLKKARHDAMQVVLAAPTVLLANLNAATALYNSGASPEEIIAAGTPRKADAAAAPPPANDDDDDVFTSRAPAASAPAHADDYARLVTQLEAAVAYVTMLESRPGKPAYPARVGELLEELNSRALPRATPAATVDVAAAAARGKRTAARERTSYADAARKGATTKHAAPKGAVTKRPPRKKSAHGARDRQQGTLLGKSQSANPPPTPTSPPPPNSPHRLVARWPAHARAQHPQDPSVITAKLHQLEGLPPVDGVNWTRRGNLVIHARPPFTSLQLRDHKDLATTLAAIADRDSSLVLPTLDLDLPWSAVVIQGVPGASLKEAVDTFGEERACRDALATVGIAEGCVKGVKVLCRKAEDVLRPSYSVQVLLADGGTALRLQREGVFVFGTRCRVSQYRARRYGPR